MADFKNKKVTELPAQCEANCVYYVNNEGETSIYVTDNSGEPVLMRSASSSNQFIRLYGSNINIDPPDNDYFRVRENNTWLRLSESDFNNGEYRLYQVGFINSQRKLKNIFWYPNHTLSRGKDLDVVVVAQNKDMTAVIARISDMSTCSSKEYNKFEINSDLLLRQGTAIGMLLQMPRDDSGLNVILGSVNLIAEFE